MKMMKIILIRRHMNQEHGMIGRMQMKKGQVIKEDEDDNINNMNVNHINHININTNNITQ